MSNTFADGTTSEHWLPEVQRVLDKKLVSKAISTVYTGSDRLIHNPYNSTPDGSDGAATTAYTVTDFTSTDDTMTVNRRAEAAEHIDNIEQLQTNYDLAMQRAGRHAYVVADKIDQYMLNLPVAFSGVNDLDNGSMGGGAATGAPYVTSSSNINTVANTIIERIGLGNGAMERGMFWAVSPFELTDINAFMQGNGFNVSDAAIKNGYVGGTPFAGLDIYVTNNLTHTTTLGLATDATATDTVFVIAGTRKITFTFVSTIGTTAGNVLRGTNVDTTRAALTAAINGAAGAGTSYVELSTEDRKALTRLQAVAVNDNSADTMTLTTKGTITVGETLTDGTDTWTTVRRHTIAGVKGTTYLALPSGGYEFEKKAVSLKHGREVVTSEIYNGTIWHETLPEIVDVIVG